MWSACSSQRPKAKARLAGWAPNLESFVPGLKSPKNVCSGKSALLKETLFPRLLQSLVVALVAALFSASLQESKPGGEWFKAKVRDCLKRSGLLQIYGRRQGLDFCVRSRKKKIEKWSAPIGFRAGTRLNVCHVFLFFFTTMSWRQQGIVWWRNIIHNAKRRVLLEN